jgi:hypothetical protein
MFEKNDLVLNNNDLMINIQLIIIQQTWLTKHHLLHYTNGA